MEVIHRGFAAATMWRDGLKQMGAYIDNMTPKQLTSSPPPIKRRAHRRRPAMPLSINKRIMDLLESMPNDTFQVKAIAKHLRDVPPTSITATLSTLTSLGRVERTGRGQYKKKATTPS
jgi:hypothetical protein